MKKDPENKLDVEFPTIWFEPDLNWMAEYFIHIQTCYEKCCNSINIPGCNAAIFIKCKEISIKFKTWTLKIAEKCCSCCNFDWFTVPNLFSFFFELVGPVFRVFFSSLFTNG